MTARKIVYVAGLVRTDVHEDSGIVDLSCRVADGPRAIIGRTARLHLDDDEVRRILADLAVHPYWAAAFKAVTADPTVQDAASRGTYHLNSGDRRRRLRVAMATAMDAAYADRADITLRQEKS